LWVSRIQGVLAKATDDLSRTRKYVEFNNGFVERREQVDAEHRGVQEQTMNDMTFNSSSQAWERSMFGRQFGAATSFNVRYTWAVSRVFFRLLWLDLLFALFTRSMKRCKWRRGRADWNNLW